jgi:ADP-heptose:LPS heptosyltransferase
VAEVQQVLVQPAPVVAPGDVRALAAALMAIGLYVGNDSGVAHLSARLGLPTVAVFGPTDPVEWAPRGPRVVVLGGAGQWPSLAAVRAALADAAGDALQGESAAEQGE